MEGLMKWKTTGDFSDRKDFCRGSILLKLRSSPQNTAITPIVFSAGRNSGAVIICFMRVIILWRFLVNRGNNGGFVSNVIRISKIVFNGL